MFPLILQIFLSPFIPFFSLLESAVDYIEDIMKHEDCHDKELSHLIIIVEAPTQSMKSDGVHTG